MKQRPHMIMETANFHEGNIHRLRQTIETFSQLDYPDMGIKFHAFKAENVALPDYSWFPVVKDFFMDEETWREMIILAGEKNLSVWLDLFCVYGVEILRKNSKYIRGIKLQPSILDNLEIINALAEIDLSDKELIVNVAGLELSEIEAYLARFKDFNFKNIVIQMGFQNHPTKIEDSSLKKIDILRGAFPGWDLGYADHIDGEDGFAADFPVYAALRGCTYLEKHICLKRKETRYDASAALEFSEMKSLTDRLLKAQQCYTPGFITGNERKYYDKSIQKPVLKKSLRAGQLVAPGDMLFRRTDKPGLNLKELKTQQQNFFLLHRDLEPMETITYKDFKKPRIAAIVAARMKSSRLKQKAILPIQGMSSIERCLDNCLKFPYVDEVILATSSLDEDSVLGEYTLKGRAKFWQGDPEDVISRYLGACERYNIDVVVRVTGDCPVVSPEIAEFILKSHFESGADFTECRRFAVGANSQIYNVEALKRVIQLVGKADYSEHMTLYMTNNPNIFKVNYVDLPEELIRDYRLTLDYQEDLDMFNELFKRLKEENLDSTLINVFKILDEHPEIPKINAHKTLVYKTDKDLIKLLNEKTTI